MLLTILKGILIGICASVPLGPAAILVVQKSVTKGRIPGFLSGLGVCLSDTFFSVIAIFAFTFTQDFLEKNKLWIAIIGGIIVIILGINMAYSNPYRKLRPNFKRQYSPKDFLQAFLMGLTNPGAIFVIFALFAFFGVSASSPYSWSIFPLILSVCVGSAFYWFVLSFFLAGFRKYIKISSLLRLNKISGIVVIILGIFLLFDGVLSVIFPSFSIL